MVYERCDRNVGMPHRETVSYDARDNHPTEISIVTLMCLEMVNNGVNSCNNITDRVFWFPTGVSLALKSPDALTMRVSPVTAQNGAARGSFSTCMHQLSNNGERKSKGVANSVLDTVATNRYAPAP